MSTASKKGNELEKAVQLIESVIVNSFPAYQESTFIIKNKKIVTVKGVRYEIDIWVEIDPGKDYGSLFIFECKNWKKKVGKKEILNFARTIEAVNAQRGWFIAKFFPRDAKAMAEQFPRMKLLLVETLDLVMDPLPHFFHFTIQGRITSQIILNFAVVPGKAKTGETHNVDLKTTTGFFQEKAINLSDYVQEWIEEIKNERLKSFRSEVLPDGNYELEATAIRKFQRGELIIQDSNVVSMELKLHVPVQIIRPPVVSHFSVETRGRVLSLAPVQVEGGGTIEVGFIAPY